MKGSISSTVHQEFISGSARYFALLFIISSLLSTITVPQTVDAHPIGCQLAPNPTFEHGTSTNIEDWSLGAWAGGGGLVYCSASKRQIVTVECCGSTTWLVHTMSCHPRT